MGAPDSIEPKTRSTTASPYPTPRDAVDAILEHLDALGLGRWQLLDPLDADPGPTGSAVALSGQDGNRWLRPARGGLDDLGEPQRATVLAAAQVIATLLAVESTAVRASEHAARAERDAETDGLTGAPNARAWWRTLARFADRSEADGRSAVIAVIDLDDLKRVNDEQGHLAGDELLRDAASVLQAALRDGDHVARVGGDEFAVLVIDDTPPEPAPIAARLEAQLAAAGLHASVGAALFEAGDRITEVYKRADADMYRVKGGRRTPAQLATSSLGQPLRGSSTRIRNPAASVGPATM